MASIFETALRIAPSASNGEEGAGESVPNSARSPDKNRSNCLNDTVTVTNARNRIAFQYGPSNNEDALEFILRVRVPFLTQEELDKEKEEAEQERRRDEQNRSKSYSKHSQSRDKSILDQSSDNKDKSVLSRNQRQEQAASAADLEEEQQPPMKDKYDEYVDTYDGEGFNRLRRAYHRFTRRKDIRAKNEPPQQFNINAFGQNKGALWDERAQVFLRAALLRTLREIYAEKLKSIEDDQVLEKCFEIDEKIDKTFLKDEIKRLPDIAVYDYEY